MSMFSMPELPTPMTMLDDMTKQTKAMMPAQFASTVNLMAHPIASAAALSAMSAGMAGHAIGVWFGTVSAAAAASQRVFLQFTDAEASDVDAFRDALRTPALRATETATALIAEVETAVKGPAKPRKPAARATAPLPEAKATEAEAEAKPSGEPDAPGSTVIEQTETAPSAETTAEVTEAVTAPAVAEPAAATVAPAAASRQPAAIVRPERPDDLKAISGIGPKLEQVLNGMGIWSYGQIARLDGAETAWLDDALGFRGRIGRDDWVAQAAKLARGEG